MCASIMGSLGGAFKELQWSNNLPNVLELDQVGILLMSNDVEVAWGEDLHSLNHKTYGLWYINIICIINIIYSRKWQNQLNNAPASFPGMVVKFKQRATHHYGCTRNNNFSNRSQKGTIIVKWSTNGWSHNENIYFFFTRFSALKTEKTKQEN